MSGSSGAILFGPPGLAKATALRGGCGVLSLTNEHGQADQKVSA